MKKFILLLAAIAIVTMVFAQPEIKYKEMDWLLGNWKMDAGEVQIYENWKKGNGDYYLGEGFVVKGKDTIVTEIIRIEKIGDFWVYIAQVNDNSPVLFTLLPGSTAKELTFENKEHDDPQRVIYKFTGKNEMYARTETIRDGETRAADYIYKRP